MNLSQYALDTKPDFLAFEFFSEGPHGRIKKNVQFNKIIITDSGDDIYNLGFGDFNEKENKVDDLVVSNNRDSKKILATVAATVLLFMERHRIGFCSRKHTLENKILYNGDFKIPT